MKLEYTYDGGKTWTPSEIADDEITPDMVIHKLLPGQKHHGQEVRFGSELVVMRERRI
jgi:hypothetical protein